MTLLVDSCVGYSTNLLSFFYLARSYKRMPARWTQDLAQQRLDYCNSLLHGLPPSTTQLLQLAMNL